MTSYIDKSLSPGEAVVLRAGVALPTIIPCTALGIVQLGQGIVATHFGAVSGGFPLIFYFTAFLAFTAVAVMYYGPEYTVTNTRLVAKYGLISLTAIEIPLYSIETVQVRQSVFARLCGFGDLVVAGAGVPTITINATPDPVAFRKTLLEMRNRYMALAKASSRTQRATP